MSDVALQVWSSDLEDDGPTAVDVLLDALTEEQQTPRIFYSATLPDGTVVTVAEPA